MKPPEAEPSCLDESRFVVSNRPRFPFTIFFFVWLLTVVVATIVTLMLPETYSSTARIRVNRDGSDIRGLTDGTRINDAYDPYFIQTEFEVIQSELILGKVIADLDLNRVWASKYGGVQALKTPETMAILKRSLDLRPVRNTSLIEIRVFSEKPEEAAKLANAVADTYRDHRLKQRRELSATGIESLEKRWAEQEAKIRLAQKELDDLREKLKVPDAMASTDAPAMLMSAETLRRIDGLRIESQAEFVRQDTLLKKLRELTPDQLAQALPTASQDPLLGSLLEQLTLAEQRLAILRRDHGREYPDTAKAAAEAEDLRNKITKRVNGILLGLEARVASQQMGLKDLQAEADKVTQQDIQRAKQSRPYFEKKRELEELQRLRQLLYTKISSERIDLELPKTSMVEIIDRAVPGWRPVRPNKALNLIVGLGAGAAAGLTLATLVYLLQLRGYLRSAGRDLGLLTLRQRILAHTVLGLLVAVCIGYLCSEPYSYTTIIGVPVILIVGCWISAWIEIRNLRVSIERMNRILSGYPEPEQPVGSEP